jgi:hypothetical protein
VSGREGGGSGGRCWEARVNKFIYEPSRKAEMDFFWVASWGTIFGGGAYRVPASENRFMEASFLRRPSPKIDYFWRRLF